MDPITLAATIVGLLVPFITKAGDKFAEQVGENLYPALKARFGAKPAAKEALDDLEKTPKDADAQAAMRQQLKKLLIEDPDFAAQVEKMVHEEESRQGISVQAGERGVAAGHDIRGNVITGDIKGPITIGDEGTR